MRLAGGAFLAFGAAAIALLEPGLDFRDPATPLMLACVAAGGLLVDYSRDESAEPRLIRGAPIAIPILLVASAVEASAAFVPFVREAALAMTPVEPWAIAYRWCYVAGSLVIVGMTLFVVWYVIRLAFHKGLNWLGLDDHRIVAIERWPENGEGSALERYLRYARARLRRDKQEVDARGRRPRKR